MIATVLFTSLTFGQSTIKYSDYGFYHNEALSSFTNKYGENQKDINLIIDESIKLMQIKYPQLFNDIDGTTIKNLFVVKSANDFDYKKIWNSGKENFYKNGKVSRKIIDLIDTIVNNDKTYEQAITAMDNFESSNRLTADESNYLTAVKSVLVSSNQYWNSAMVNRHRPGSATLIADFAGAGMFLWSGPVAAICGFACSYLTHQNDN